MGVERTATRTPATAPQLAGVIANVWPTVFGSTPLTREAVAMLVAQIGVETGPNFTNVWNFNVGNLEPTGGFDYVNLHVGGGLRPFRAFTSFVDGVTGYLSLLHARYRVAIGAALVGDVPSFVGALKASGYFEEPEAQYLAAMEPEYTAIARELAAPSPPPAPAAAPPSTLAQAGIGGAVLLAILLGALAAAFRHR
jgi:hypothetical protein